MEIEKISLITVCRNAAGTIQRCIDSVKRQRNVQVEYIVVDGNSIDGTLGLILKNQAGIDLFISEADGGIYDAINKGILQASGNIIGLLNADDYLADEHVLADIARTFAVEHPDVLYADLDYVDPQGRIVRKWRSGKFVRNIFNWGWMPPHPTFYAKRRLFDDFGLYETSYGSAADYELMLRFMHGKRIRISYLDRVIVKMGTGGISNRSLYHRMLAWKADFRAMKKNNIKHPSLAIILKPVRKIWQFIH